MEIRISERADAIFGTNYFFNGEEFRSNSRHHSHTHSDASYGNHQVGKSLCWSECYEYLGTASTFSNVIYYLHYQATVVQTCKADRDYFYVQKISQ